MRQYLVYCWIRPQSGFDLASKNKLMEMFREYIETHFENRHDFDDLDKARARFEEQNDGLVVKDFILETDEEVSDCEEQLMPEIRKTYPEAKLLSWQPLPIVA